MERIDNLKSVAYTPSVAVTVLYARGKVKVTAVTTDRITPEDVKFVLNLGVDEVTAQLVLQRLQQGGAEEPPEGLPELPQDE